MKIFVLSQVVTGISLCFLVSCSVREFDSAEELNAYVIAPQHELTQQTEHNGYTIAVAYKPTDMLVDHEIGESPAGTADINSLRKKYSTYYYFVLSLSKDNNEALHQLGGRQYSDLVQRLSFRMNEYVTLTTSGRDTIPVSDFILNRTYGLSKSTDLLFVFNNEKAKGKDWVQFNLNEFGLGVGNQRFRFDINNIEEIPKIDFTKVSRKTK